MGKKKSVVLITLISIVVAILCAITLFPSFEIPFRIDGTYKSWNPVVKQFDLSADLGGGYYTYYYYWIRHNDNGDNAVMGPMEFAVVRNNVYKLCVDNIYKLGHPTPGKDPDPDSENYMDPDESLNYYFNVTVDVLPWTVRVNNIEF